MIAQLVFLKPPNTKGNARTRGVTLSDRMPRVSANSVLHSTITRKDSLKGGTRRCVDTKRLIPSSLVLSLVGRHLKRSSTRTN